MVESWGLSREHHIQINRGRIFDDALAALPVTAVNLAIEHAPSELPVGKGLDAFATDHDFAKFAEDRRRSLRTTVFF